MANNNEAIAFDTFVENATKAMHTTADLEAFKVYGTISQNGAVVTNIFPGVPVTKGTNGWGYSSEYTQYWIPGFIYDFTGVVDGEVAVDANGMPATISTDMTAQNDVLYATVNREFKTGDQAAKVSFNFAHLLSKAKFTVKNTISEGQNFVYNIESVKIINADATAVYDVANSVWSASGAYEADYEVAADIAQGANTVSKDVLLVPGTKELAIAIKYNLKYNNATLVNETKNLTAVLTLEKGKAYNFVVEFGNPGEEIEFEATVNDWVSAGDFTNYLKDVELNGQVLPGLGKDVNTPDVVYVTANEGLASLSALVVVDGMAGKTVKLLKDIDLNGVDFAPIGYNNGDKKYFEGTFDGNNKTIRNLKRTDLTYANKRAIGLFSQVKNATVKNLTLEDFVAATYGGEAAAIACEAVGDCTFENLTFKKGSVVAYNNDTAPVIGWANKGNFTLKNITVGSDVVIYSLWDSYDTSLGGLIGTLESPSTVTIENATVSCVLNAFNDVCSNYQWGAYRRTGMLIGNMSETQTINGTTYPDPAAAGVTCNNVTVTYGDWMNYHYCEFESNGKPSYADPGEWKFSRVEGQEWGRESNIDTDNCQHDTDESHNICLPVDQLFGGGQGVYGLREYAGVTVNYPASYRREVASAAALTEALGKGVSVILDADIDFGSTQLAITGENQVVDLGGHTLTTANNWGGISLKNGASIKNGTITHAGNTAAIKAFNGSSVENVTINATCTTADKTVTGIAVQQGANIESIKNVTINGVSQGIEVGYQATVGLIENAVVNESNNGTAKGIGLVINGGKVGKAKDCTFKGETYGVTMHLKGVFAVGLELENCQVEGTTASIYAWDEKGVSNTSGSLNLTYDAATTLTGPFVWDFEDECQSVVTLNRPL